MSTPAIRSKLCRTWTGGKADRHDRNAKPETAGSGASRGLLAGTWNPWPLGEEPIVRLILDGTVVRVRHDRRATSISLLVALGVRFGGQKVLLAVRSMGGESEAARRALLDDLIKRGLRTPELVIADGAPHPGRALAALWPATSRSSAARFTSRNFLAQRARAPARGNIERLSRHDLRRDAAGGRSAAKGLRPQWRTKSALAAAKAKGVKLGHPNIEAA